MKKLVTVISILFIVAAVYTCGEVAAKWRSKNAFKREKTYIVERVIDVDTILVTTSKKKFEKVRLIGIGSIESNPANKVKRGSEGTGQGLETIARMRREAKELVEGLVKKGDKVELEFDAQEKDEDDRLYAYVFVNIQRKEPRSAFEARVAYYEISPGEKISIFLNASIIKAGYAASMAVSSDAKYVDLFKRLHKDAFYSRRGLWNTQCLITSACALINCDTFGYSVQSGYGPECVDRTCKCVLWIDDSKGIKPEKAIKSAVKFLKKNKLNWGKPIGAGRAGGIITNGIHWFIVEFEQEKSNGSFILVNPETAKAEFPES